MFDTIDSDGSGKLSVDELKMHFRMGLDSDAEWEEMIKEVDENDDGEISYLEFLNIMDKMVK